jgi:hypothetical protein
MVKKQLFHLVCVSLIALFFTAEATAIEIKLSERGTKRGLFSGAISSGDTQKAAAFFLKNPHVIFLYLDSPGGDVVEAIRLGELVRTLRIQVQVADRGLCASACFFVWLNGSYRSAAFDDRQEVSGRVGLHRPYLVNPANQETSLLRQSGIITGVRGYLESNFIPRRLIDIMMSRPSNDIYWLTENDLDELSPTPPALEELYLAKCQANVRQLLAQKTNSQNNSVKNKQIDNRLEEIFDCTATLDLSAHAAAIKKLSSGWLPPIPFTRKQ